MDSSLPHHRLIILYFRRYASGNFLANILCHNREFVPKFDFNFTNRRYVNSKDILNLSDDDLFAAQLNLLKTTIPETKEECKNWPNYELGCDAFWCKDPYKFHAMHEVELWIWKANLRLEPYRLMKRNKRCFIIMHDLIRQRYYKDVFPDATIVQLVNDKRTVDRGIKLKAPESMVMEPNRPVLDGAIQFDIDSLWEKDLFFKNVDNLLETLNVRDKTLDSSVDEYYTRYINLYN